MTAEDEPGVSSLASRLSPMRAARAAGRLLRLPTQLVARHDELLEAVRAVERDEEAGRRDVVAAVRASLVDDIEATDARLSAIDATLAELRAELREQRDAAAVHAAQRADAIGPVLDAVNEAIDTARQLQREVDEMSSEIVRHVDGIAIAQLDGLRRVASSTASVADHLAATDDYEVEPGPLASVVMAVRDRPHLLRRAVGSVLTQTYQRWELVVVDDGSAEPVDAASITADPRVRVVRIPSSGAAAARNAGLAVASGEFITFLDSDNEWFPARLSRVVAAMGAMPWAGWAIDGQLLDDTPNGLPFVRNIRLPLEALEQENFIDLGALVVRRHLLDEVGGFDEGLDRLQDWDLVRRLASRQAPERLPTIGYRYHDDQTDRISAREPVGPAMYRIKRRALGMPGEGLRVLVAEWHYPQLTETYIEVIVQSLRALGAHVEVWSEDDVAVPHPTSVPLHRGSLETAIQAVRPDIVFTHWVHKGIGFRPTTKVLGVPHAVRLHGFDHDPGTVDELLRDPNVVVHMYPHLAGPWRSHPRVSVDPAAFDTARYAPAAAKDRRLVVRLMAGLRSKDVEVFLETAKRCPDHRFVLGVAPAYRAEEQTEQIVALAGELGAPVEIRRDVSFEDAAALVSSAGIYVHTHGTAHPPGMPISIAEAMATGAFVVVRNLPGMADYVGRGGALYWGDDVVARADAAAAIINATRQWSDDRWREAWMASVDEAWTRFPGDLVVAGMLTSWREGLGVGAPSGSR